MKSEIQYFLNKSPYGNKQLQYHKPHTPEKPDQYYTKKEIDYLLKNIDISNKVDKEEGKGLSTNDYTTDDKTKLNTLPTNNELTTILNGKVDTDDLNEYVPKTYDDHGNISIYSPGNLVMTLTDEQGSVNQTGTFYAGGWSVSSPDGKFQTFGNSIYRGTMGFDHDSVVWEKTATQQIPAATTETNGLMSAEDKKKLDDMKGVSTASDVSYDNSKSGLSATNVQNAIDEMADTNLYETVVLTIGSADSSFNPVGQTITVTLEDGSATQYTVPMSRQITFIVQRGMRYNISGTSTDDYRVLPISVKASIPIRYLTMRYIPIATGVFILQKDGNYYLREEYDAETMAKDAVGVLVLTSALINAGFGIVIGKNDTFNSSTVWYNGTNPRDSYYRDVNKLIGYANTTSMVGKGLYPAAAYCREQSIEITNKTLLGYLLSKGECSILASNNIEINNCLTIVGGINKDFSTANEYYTSTDYYHAGGLWYQATNNKGKQTTVVAGNDTGKAKLKIIPVYYYK